MFEGNQIPPNLYRVRSNLVKTGPNLTNSSLHSLPSRESMTTRGGDEATGRCACHLTRTPWLLVLSFCRASLKCGCAIKQQRSWANRRRRTGEPSCARRRSLTAPSSRDCPNSSQRASSSSCPQRSFLMAQPARRQTLFPPSSVYTDGVLAASLEDQWCRDRGSSRRARSNLVHRRSTNFHGEGHLRPTAAEFGVAQHSTEKRIWFG